MNQPAELSEQGLRLFVSSPGDVEAERRRVDLVAERLNAEFAGRLRIETVRWEASYYSAHDTFQGQIPESAECDVVVAIFRGRLGTPLPAGFPRTLAGEPYPSGTAYEVLSAIENRRAGKPLPDVYVFRQRTAPSVSLDASDRAEVEAQWAALRSFFDRWFHTPSGEFLAAFQTFLSTDDFARRVEECLRQWLARRGYAEQGAVWDRVLHGSPFPGLAAFGADRSRVFFGRDLATAHAIDRLRAAPLPFLLLIGASGSGKSSLLRAGLLPRLVLPGMVAEIDLWRAASMTPGPDPFAALADALLADAALGEELRAGLFRTPETLARQLAGDLDTALLPLRDALDRAAAHRQAEAGFDAPRPARLALGIDQAERLFTEAEPAAAARFAALLAALVRGGVAAVLMALRSDAYPRFQGEPALLALRQDGATFDLVPPGTAELEEIVTRPVAACRPPLAFAPGLAARLVADARGGDALPLLQVTLARLYAAEAARGDGVLDAADYAGMGAAVTDTANEALATLDAPARAALPAMVAGLVADVTTDPHTGAPVPVAAALDRAAFASSPARAALLDAFVAKRLLTAEEGRVRPVHEALLRIWPQAVAILEETASLIRVRHTLAPLVREWRAAGATAEYLEVSPALLDGAQRLLSRFGDDLPADMRAFIGAAAAADTARRDRERAEAERRVRDAEALAAANRRTARRTMLGLGIAVVLMGLAGWQWREAGQQRDRATRSLAEADEQRDRAKRSLELATATADGLVFDLAGQFRTAVGMPLATVKKILDRARLLQDQLLPSNDTSLDLKRGRGVALGEISTTLLTLGDSDGALQAAQQAVAVFETLLAIKADNVLWQRDLSIAQSVLGDVQRARGNLDAALDGYGASLAIRDRLASADPANTPRQQDLSIAQELMGDLKRDRGDLPAALGSYRAAFAITERLASADPGNASLQRQLSIMQNNIGDVQRAQGELAAAQDSYQASLAIVDRLAKSDPGNTDWQRDLSISQDRIGNVQRAQGHLAAALESYLASFAIRDRLVRSDPGNAVWQRDLSVSQNLIGDAQWSAGDLPAALGSYRASFAIRDRLARADPGNTLLQRDLAISLENIGDAQGAQKNFTAALDSYRASLAIRDRLARSAPGNAVWQRDLSIAEGKVGDVQATHGNWAAALESYQASLAIRDRLVRSDPGNTLWQRDLGLNQCKLALVEAQQRSQGAAQRFQAGRDILVRLSRASPMDAQLRSDVEWADRQAALLPH